jgi:hypothetical protein
MKGERKELAKAFRRNPDGSWLCVARIVIDHPKGRMEVASGTRLVRERLFMGVDLAAWLDEQLK